MTNTHYLALYRKYRPQTFEDVCGRDTIVRTLKNQINTGHIGHSYLFCGTRGTGKTTIAKIFAKAINCEHPVDGSPCGECSSCLAIAKDANLNVVEMDAASNNGVDDIRNIIEQVSYSPSQGRYRVFIIDEVHMLSSAAFNALLKTLEEPPSYAVFILATTEPNKLPVTILSRCQRYDFGRLSVSTIEDRLKTVCERENLNAEEKALNYIASAADGSMRDGLSILDQCNAFNYGNNTLTYEKALEILGAVDVSVFSRIFSYIHDGEVKKALDCLDEILSQGRELVQFVTDFIAYLRNVMLLKASEDVGDSLDVSGDHLEMMIEDARRSDMEEILRYITVFSELTEKIRYSANRRILTEAAMIRLCNPAMDISKDTESKFITMQERIRVLEDRLLETEKKLQSGAFVAASNAGAGSSYHEQQADNASLTANKKINERTDAAQQIKKLPAAVLDDIKNIAAKWDSIIGAIPSDKHFMKRCLMAAKPSVGNEGQLVLVFDNFIYHSYFADGAENAEHRKALEEFISQKTGRQVNVSYKLLDNGSSFNDNYIDIRNIANVVNFTIEEDK